MKTCFKCGGEKPLTEFYKHKQMKDGHLNKCKICTKKDASMHRSDNLDKIRAYDRERGKLPHRINKNIETTRRLRLEFPLKYKAHCIVGNAVRDKKIMKPTVCSACLKDGRQIEGHHDDYSKPLDVIWLCAACHRQLHRDMNNLNPF